MPHGYGKVLAKPAIFRLLVSLIGACSWSALKNWALLYTASGLYINMYDFPNCLSSPKEQFVYGNNHWKN